MALVAQFPQYLSLPSKFPDNWWLLASCVATYGVLTLALNTFTSYHEGNAFVFLHVAEVQPCACRLVGGASRSAGVKSPACVGSRLQDIPDCLVAAGAVAPQLLRSLMTARS